MEKVAFHFELNEDQKKLKDKMYEKLLKDKHVKAFMKKKNVDDTYIYDHCGKISDWSTQISKCDRCEGLDFCRQPMIGHYFDLEIDVFLNECVKKCKYLIEKEKAMQHRSQYRIMDMNEELLKVDISNINLEHENIDYKNLINQVAASINENKGKGIYFCGKPGAGKTYLAAGIANYYAKKDKRVAFVNVPKFIADLKLLFFDNQAMEMKLQQIQHVDILILDDIGGESVTAWSRDEILLPLLDKRMERKKLTFFTSNYKMSELYERIIQTTNKMSEPVAAERLMDRIKALSCEIFVKGDSRRK